MEVQALTRYARMSPKKVREVARTIQGRKAADAVDYLMLVPRKSARLIAKTLKSAIANAENNNNLSADSLTVKSAIIENGPVLKRFKARVDHRRYNGAALLGLRGLVFKSHGSADALAFENALSRAYDAASHRLLDGVHERIARTLNVSAAVTHS